MPAAEPSPDGRFVAYISTNDGGVYVRDVASGEVQQLASGLPSVWNYFPIWSPDGRRLAFSAEDRETKVMAVRIVEVRSGESTVVPGTTVDGWIDVEDWSRDGRHFLCNTGEEQISLIAVDDGSKIALTDSAYLGNGALSPDGRFVAYAVGTEEDAQIFIQPVMGGPRRQITSTPGGNYRPQWDPDGSAIAWQGPSGIWVLPISDGQPSGNARLAVSANRITVRRWIRSGLYYSQFTDAGQRSVPYQVPMDVGTGRPGAGGVQVVTGDRPDSVTAFAWSPDMRRIAFGHRLSPEITIAAEEPKSTVTWDLGRQGHPLRTLRWSSDGREVLYEVERWFWRSEGSTVTALDPETGHVRELFPRILEAAGFSLSADGGTMAFYRLALGDSTASWPSGGSGIAAVMVSSVGQHDGRAVAAMGGEGEMPFSSTVPPALTLEGDRVLFVRQAAIEDDRTANSDAASLWVVESNGSGARHMASAAFIESAIWDPTGRFIAYTAIPDVSDPSTVLRVVDVATGVGTDVPLPDHISGNLGYLRLTNWSSDGRVIGMVAGRDFDSQWELWAARGLENASR